MKTGVTINDQPIDIPTTWDEITFGQFLRMKEATDAEALHILTGIDLELCQQIKPEILEAILSPVSELGEVVFNDEPIISNNPVPTSIGKLEFSRKVNCDNLARKYEDEEMVGRMVAVYCAEGTEDEDIEATYELILNEPFTSVVSAGKLISDQLIELKKSEDKIRPPEYENEELRAGIKDFSKYGIFGLVRGIALRHGCTLEDVYGWSYNSVLLELKYSSDENAYQRKLNRIMSQKK